MVTGIILDLSACRITHDDSGCEYLAQRDLQVKYFPLPNDKGADSSRQAAARSLELSMIVYQSIPFIIFSSAAKKVIPA